MSGPAIPGMNVGLGIQMGDHLMHEPTGCSGIVVGLDLAAGRYSLVGSDGLLTDFLIGPADFSMWWRQSRNLDQGRAFDTIKHATHDPEAIKVGILKLKEDRSA